MLVDICEERYLEEDRLVMNGLIVDNQEVIERMGLKPCPFCGRKVQSVEITTESNSFETSVEMVVECWCGAEVHIWATSKEQDGLDKAIELWNSRTAEAERKEE